MIDINKLREYANQHKLFMSQHASNRCEQRRITKEDPESVNHLGEIFSENLKILCLWRYVFLQCFHPIVKKYLESYNPKTLAVIRFLAHFHLLGSRIQGRY